MSRQVAPGSRPAWLRARTTPAFHRVFRIDRMREGFRRTSSNYSAIIALIRHTARPVTAAAAIMVAVFDSFVTADVLELKQSRFASAVAVTFEAMVVRPMLVPAPMKVFGKRDRRPATAIGSAPRP